MEELDLPARGRSKLWVRRPARCRISKVKIGNRRNNLFDVNDQARAELWTRTFSSIDEYLRERLMPVEGAIPHIPGIEMFGNSIPAGTVGGDLFEYINFQQRYDIDARIQQAE